MVFEIFLSKMKASVIMWCLRKAFTIYMKIWEESIWEKNILTFFQMTTKMVWVWLGSCLINLDKTLKQTLFNALYKMLGKIWEHEIYQIQNKKKAPTTPNKGTIRNKNKSQKSPIKKTKTRQTINLKVWHVNNC